VKTPILGSAYVARSVNAADSQMINLFPEMVPEAGKEPAFLQRCPGLNLKINVGSGPIRGMWWHGVYLYVVSGSTFYQITSSWVATAKGTVAGTGPVSIADNGTQIMIAANPTGYIYNTNTGVFAQIVDPDFPGASVVDYLDGYFVFIEPNSQRIWVTGLLDGTTVDPLDFVSAEGDPDNIVSMIVDHREVWLFGENSTEVWYNAGLSDFPLVRIQGAFNELGCAARYSVAKMNNQVYWLGKDDRGRGIVYQANGYQGQRISTHAIEWQIQQYSTLTDVVGYTYQQDGHSFYVLVFPSSGATWAYDATTGAWHERAGWDNGSWVRQRPVAQISYQDDVLVGDYENGNIYAYDLDVYTDNGAPQRWLRSWRALPTGQNDLMRTAQHALQLDCQTGVGLVTGQGSDPEVMLRWSDDGGHTWSNEHWRKMGAIGQYGFRTIWRRLGMTMKLRDRVYEVSGTDPVKIAIMGAELQVSRTNA